MSTEFTGNEEMDTQDFSWLARYEEDYQQAPVERNSNTPDDDDYLVRVDKAFLGKSKANNDLLKWEMTIFSGKTTGEAFAGRKLFRNNMFATQTNLKWLKTDLANAGVMATKIVDLPETVKKLSGVFLHVSKKAQLDGRNYAVYISRRAAADEIPAQTTEEGTAAFQPEGSTSFTAETKSAAGTVSTPESVGSTTSKGVSKKVPF